MQTPAIRLDAHISQISELVERLSGYLLEASQIAKHEKDIPCRPQILSALESMTTPSALIISHALSVRAFLSRQMKPITPTDVARMPFIDEDKDKDGKEEKPAPTSKDEKKEHKVSEERWTACAGCDNLIEVSQLDPKAMHHFCELCISYGRHKQKSRIRRQAVTTGSGSRSESKETTDKAEVKSTLAVVASIKDAKKVMHKFAEVHTSLSFKVTHEHIDGLSDNLNRCIFRIEQNCNQIRQTLNEMEVACDQEVLQHHKREHVDDVSTSMSLEGPS